MRTSLIDKEFLKAILKLTIIVVLLVLASYWGNWVIDQFSPHLTPSTEPAIHRIIVVSIIMYVLLMMLPFVPGAEIGLGMMMVFGPKAVPIIYLCTLIALSLSFILGRFISPKYVIEFLESLHLKRAGGLLRGIEKLDSDERLKYLIQTPNNRLLPFLLRHRYLAIVLALNIPGNSLIGGGGGICLTSGFSRLFSMPLFVLTLSIAIAPVPITILLTNLL